MNLFTIYLLTVLFCLFSASLNIKRSKYFLDYISIFRHKDTKYEHLTSGEFLDFFKRGTIFLSFIPVFNIYVMISHLLMVFINPRKKPIQKIIEVPGFIRYDDLYKIYYFENEIEIHKNRFKFILHANNNKIVCKDISLLIYLLNIYKLP